MLWEFWLKKRIICRLHKPSIMLTSLDLNPPPPPLGEGGISKQLVIPDRVGGLLLPIEDMIHEPFGAGSEWALSAALRGHGRELLRVWRHWDYCRVCHFNRLLVWIFLF